MKILLPILFTLAAFLQAAAQLPAPDQALAEAEKRFRALETYSCTLGFEISGSDHKDDGKVYFQGLKYHLDFPEDQTIFDGAVIMNWSKGFGSVDFMSPQEGPDFSLGGLYRLHRERYRFEWTDTTGSMAKMMLTAKDDGMVVPRAYLSINKQTGLIVAYTLMMSTGMTILYETSEVQQNPVLDPKLFAIDWAFVKRVQDGEVPPVPHEH